MFGPKMDLYNVYAFKQLKKHISTLHATKILELYYFRVKISIKNLHIIKYLLYKYLLVWDFFTIKITNRYQYIYAINKVIDKPDKILKHKFAY